MKVLFALFVFTSAFAQAQEAGETFTYEIEIARKGDIETGADVQFEKRVVSLQFMGKEGWFSKKVIFTFGENGKPAGQFAFENKRWSQGLEMWAYATANANQCLQVSGNFLMSGAQIGGKPYDTCQIRGTRESLMVGYTILNLPTPMQYELEERGRLVEAAPGALPVATYLPPELVKHLNLVTNEKGMFWYRARLVNHAAPSWFTRR